MSERNRKVISYLIPLLDPNRLTLATDAIPTDNLPSRPQNTPDPKPRQINERVAVNCKTGTGTKRWRNSNLANI